MCLLPCIHAAQKVLRGGRHLHLLTTSVRRGRAFLRLRLLSPSPSPRRTCRAARAHRASQSRLFLRQQGALRLAGPHRPPWPCPFRSLPRAQRLHHRHWVHRRHSGAASRATLRFYHTHTRSLPPPPVLRPLRQEVTTMSAEQGSAHGGGGGERGGAGRIACAELMVAGAQWLYRYTARRSSWASGTHIQWVCLSLVYAHDTLVSSSLSPLTRSRVYLLSCVARLPAAELQNQLWAAVSRNAQLEQRVKRLTADLDEERTRTMCMICMDAHRLVPPVLLPCVWQQGIARTYSLLRTRSCGRWRQRVLTRVHGRALVLPSPPPHSRTSCHLKYGGLSFLLDLW